MFDVNNNACLIAGPNWAQAPAEQKAKIEEGAAKTVEYFKNLPKSNHFIMNAKFW